MMSEIHECIAAFADGERVDPAQLDQALADEEGRAYLIDLLVLRGLYARRDALPAADARARNARLRWLPVVAALVVVSGLGGYLAGRQGGERAPAGPAGPLTVQSEVTAPAPTQVIRLEPGVDWKERGGGD
jgi:hypothetical protein